MSQKADSAAHDLNRLDNAKYIAQWLAFCAKQTNIKQKARHHWSGLAMLPIEKLHKPSMLALPAALEKRPKPMPMPMPMPERLKGPHDVFGKQGREDFGNAVRSGKFRGQDGHEYELGEDGDWRRSPPISSEKVSIPQPGMDPEEYLAGLQAGVYGLGTTAEEASRVMKERGLHAQGQRD